MTAGSRAPTGAERRRVTVQGVVQGVGFRPFVHRLAAELGLSGHVANTGHGVVCEVEGAQKPLAEFCTRIGADAPPAAVVESVRHEVLPAQGSAGFSIGASRAGEPARTLVSPDLATCAACCSELSDPSGRRYRHPFVTCTYCGPRFTIVEGLPYDRANTTMAAFVMCARCEAEYTDPADRRFHAQPVSCHDCGPRLRLLVRGADGRPEPAGGDPVASARKLLADGRVVAVKGLGGYHLVCDAADERAVGLLRERKQRGTKPFALMVPDTDTARRLCHVDGDEEAVLTGSRRPVVLLRRRSGPLPGTAVPARTVAPGSAEYGMMLPYTPLHHLLFGLPGDPPGPQVLVMTSGNLGGEPIVTGDGEALTRLAPLTDAWLVHDRRIHVPCDDSVVRVFGGHLTPVRRSRGYAPFPVPLPVSVSPALAVGGDLKNVFCLGEDRRAWLSAHIGDLDGLAALNAFGTARRQLEEITGVRPGTVVADRHPGYRSVSLARRCAGGRPLRRVQHHHAHIASVMAENGLDGSTPVIGVAFDGTGYGDDGAVWGGEFLLADYDGYERFAHLRYTPLPGGDAAVHRPYRMALAHLWAAGLPWDPRLPCVRACPEDELGVLERQLARGLHCVPTSGAGRLFDAVSALAGICTHATYEAQAAMELEAAATGAADTGGYAFTLQPADGGPLTADPAPVLEAAAADVVAGCAPGTVAVRFHTAVARMVREVCRAAREHSGLETVALSGGVFVNSLLSSACSRLLREDGFGVLLHGLVPPNDGGLALGQLVVAARTGTSRGMTAQPERGSEEAHVPGSTRQGPGHRGT